MKNLYNPKWLMVVNTLPISILFFICYQEYNIIHSLLEEENTRYWLVFGVSLAGLAIGNLLYALHLIRKKKEISVSYAACCLPVYIAWMYLYVYHSEYIITFNIPRWMITDEIFICAGAFLMPTLAYSVLLLVAACTRHPEKRKAWINFLVVIIIPAMFYLFFTGLLPLWQAGWGILDGHLNVIFFIICTLALLFFFCRGIYIMVSKKSPLWNKLKLIWKPLIVLVLPIVGLFFNNVFFAEKIFIKDGGVLGNFNNVWFYILAVLNGIVLCMPDLPKKTYRYALYLMRCVTYAYTLYFFIVFLPFLPFSIIAILAAGLGFLMLTPLLLFLVHTHQLYSDFCYLKHDQSVNRIIGIGMLGTLVIPVCVSLSYIHDRQTLHCALEYAYEADYNKTYHIDKKAVTKALCMIRAQKGHGNSVLLSPYYTPYLSSYYNWVVLDNLTLSDSKIEMLEYLYGGKVPRYGNGMTKPDQEERGNSSVRITQLEGTSRYDHDTRSWISSVDIELTNTSRWSLPEYATQFQLPDGCWISDYYLYVGDKKEKGMLVEKKAAMWVYSQILSIRRDPGILYYDTGNEIIFRVFPFNTHEVRKTGIEFIHKEPFTLQLDDHMLVLGNKQETAALTDSVIEINGGDALYVSSSAKKNLDIVTRRPYFHFVADASIRAQENREWFIASADSLLTAYPLLAENARITLADTYVHTYEVNDPWQQTYLEQQPEGGFFLDRAIKTALAAGNGSDVYPVIVVLTDDIRYSLMDKNYADFRFLYPEAAYIYVLNDSSMTAHSLLHQTYYPVADSLFLFPPSTDVRVYTDAIGRKSYLRNDTTPEIIVKDIIAPTKEINKTSGSWEQGLHMQAYWTSQQLHPGTSRNGWLELVKMSFTSGIMSPLTSYIVVENETQKAALEQKQKEVMSGHKSLDTIERMSEPELYILLLLLLPLLWIARKRERT